MGRAGEGEGEAGRLRSSRETFPQEFAKGKIFQRCGNLSRPPSHHPLFFSNRDFIIEFHGERLASGGGRAGGDVENKRNCTRFRPLHAMTRRPLCPGKFCNKCSRNNLPSGSSPGPYLVSLRFPPPPLPPAIIDNALL